MIQNHLCKHLQLGQLDVFQKVFFKHTPAKMEDDGDESTNLLSIQPHLQSHTLRFTDLLRLQLSSMKHDVTPLDQLLQHLMQCQVKLAQRKREQLMDLSESVARKTTSLYNYATGRYQ